MSVSCIWRCSRKAMVWFGDKVAGILASATRPFGMSDGRVWSELMKSTQTAIYIQDIPQQRGISRKETSNSEKWLFSSQCFEVFVQCLSRVFNVRTTRMEPSQRLACIRFNIIQPSRSYCWKTSRLSGFLFWQTDSARFNILNFPCNLIWRKKEQTAFKVHDCTYEGHIKLLFYLQPRAFPPGYKPFFECS